MKFAVTIVTFASAVLSMVSAQGGTYTDMVNVAAVPQLVATSATLSPYPMCIKRDACLTLIGTLSDPIIEGARYQITGRYIGRLVYVDETEDWCAYVANSTTPCPIAAGPITLNLCRLVKVNIPPN
ncbi:hypothetical protein BG015_004580, partial [Linnemannia schmuckeri]